MRHSLHEALPRVTHCMTLCQLQLTKSFVYCSRWSQNCRLGTPSTARTYGPGKGGPGTGELDTGELVETPEQTEKY